MGEKGVRASWYRLVCLSAALLKSEWEQDA